MMRFHITRIVTLLLVFIGVVVINNNSQVVFAEETIASLVLSKNEVSLEVGSTVNLTATAVYTDNSTSVVTVKTEWVSGSTENATVYAGGITGKKEGTAVITATYNGKTVLVNVIVSKKVKALTKDKQKIDLRLNHSESVVLTAYYDDGTTEDVTTKADWSSDSNSVATVTNGSVKGLSSGTATITAKYGNQTLTLPVNVEIAKRVDAAKSEVSLLLHGTETVALTATYPDGTTEDVTLLADWSTDKETVADVLKGKITGYGPGQATIKASYGTKSTTIKVEVDNAIKLDLNKQELLMKNSTAEQLTLTATYSNGNTEEITERAEWSSSDENIAYVYKGKISANAVGEALIIAKYGEREVSIIVDVDMPRRIELSKETVSLQKGGTEQVTVIATYSDGTTEVVTDKATWSTDNGTTADVIKGKITGYATGQATITATYGAKLATLKVDVDSTLKLSLNKQELFLKKNITEQMTLTATYPTGSTEDVASRAEWTSSNESVVYVYKGKLTANAVGEAVITAKYGEKQVTMTVDVEVPRLLKLNKNSVIMQTGMTEQLTLHATYADGTVEDVTSIAKWSGTDDSIVYTSQGKITSYTAGEANVTATYGGKSATAKVQVDIPSYLKVSKKIVNLEAGGVETVVLMGTFVDGEDVDVTSSAVWTTSSSAIADVHNGTITGTSTGSATITATYGTRTVTIQVSVGVLLSLTADVSEVVLRKGATQQVVVSAKYKDGSTNSVQDDAVWSSSNTKVAIVENGLITAKDTGVTEVTATFDGKSVRVTVNVDTASSLTPSTTYLVFDLGDAIRQITLEAVDELGASRDVTNEAEWKSSNSKVALVSKGTVTPVARGKATITATYGGKSVTIAVEIGVVQKLEVDRRFISMKTGDNVTVILTATLADGSIRDVTSAATWKTASYKVADVVKGTITATGSGKTIVTGTFGGKSIGLPVDVNTLKYLKTDVVKLDLTEGQEAQVTATGSYSDGTDEDVTIPALWQSSNSMIADVKDGMIKATGKGKARITVTYSNIKWYVQITVK
ncbi:Ig-like domain-containing protein [Paenibacillus agricola]|uniref:BIG2 domain-containing protein n=1 Tax=Paenibacillus agricola TaxID=2716264 RepID=A0ABX0J8F5_9BACL|nr:Ig-like domain-containing protein [Paenibacillus agricola]NHN32258.1 hypothetical protein [Paenibacillus agricola]